MKDIGHILFGATIALGCTGLLACESPPLSTPEEAPPVAGSGPVVAARTDLQELCARPRSDAIRDVFCGPVAPQIGSLYDLQSELGIVFEQPAPGVTELAPMVRFYEDFPVLDLVVLNSSTALPGRLITTINPRAIILSRQAVMAYSRGVQRIEMMARDRNDQVLNFYLLSFQQACNASAKGCSPGDLYTPRVESGWTSVHIEDDEQLKNTAFDCRQCHQRGLATPVMLMRELTGPWTHFFGPDQDQAQGPEPSGVEIVRAYYQAKGDEPYGNVPWANLRATAGLILQLLVDLPQPLVFDSTAVLNERWPWSEEAGYASTPKASATWYRQFESFKRGEHLAMPYFEPIPGDPKKLAEFTELYRKYRTGEISADDLPDLGELYPDDPQTRAEMGLQTEPNATAAQTLIQACGSCHNDVLDQSITRARFTIDLSRLDRAALDLAIERIERPLDMPGRMPPPDARQIDPNGMTRLIEYVREARPSPDDATLLKRAAAIGMAGSPPPYEAP